MTKQEKRELSELHERAFDILENGTEDDYAEIGRAFHFAVLTGAKNSSLLQITDTLATRLIPYRRFQIRAPGQLKKNQDDHELIVKAIQSSDRELAFSLMRAHSADQDATLVRMIENAGVFENRGGQLREAPKIAAMLTSLS